MAVTKKKDPMIVAVEKKRGRPAGTRVKHRVTVESVRKSWEESYGKLYSEFMEFAQAARQRSGELESQLQAAKVTVLDQYAIIRYLEAKIGELISIKQK